VTSPFRQSRFLRWALWVAAGAVSAFFVARGVIELASIDTARPETYRNDWGGPHLGGVLAVHRGPGVLILAAWCVWLLMPLRSRNTDARA
jgi:hypothetical protein